MKLFENLQVPPNVALPLQNAIENKKISHAYLFHGNDEELLNAAAEDFAKAILCASDDRPCGSCAACVKAAAGSHADILHIYPDGASIKITQIRQLKYSVALKPFESERKIYIIHQADTMQKWAQNSLLKTLEESNKYVIIILLALNKGAFYPTVLSRCQVYPFTDIAMKATLRKKVFAIFASAHEKNYEHVLERIAVISNEDAAEVLSCISSFVRDLLAYKLSGARKVIQNTEYADFIQGAAEGYSVDMLQDVMTFICDIRINASTNMALMLQAIFLRF